MSSILSLSRPACSWVQGHGGQLAPVPAFIGRIQGGRPEQSRQLSINTQRECIVTVLAKKVSVDNSISWWCGLGLSVVCVASVKTTYWEQKWLKAARQYIWPLTSANLHLITRRHLPSQFFLQHSLRNVRQCRGIHAFVSLLRFDFYRPLSVKKRFFLQWKQLRKTHKR